MIQEESRGVLLHFFANHELLAAELMALALLKFPDAPAAFRQGLANTLREEQIHTKWYINRMHQCGVQFGQYPVNRFFWDAVSTMECPLDYVSRLSLTFEQANLDYAHHYSKVLKEAGDSKSAAILERIYHDEISHVGYGLHWFRKWKNQDESDWTALQKRLIFPLSPSRAKGNRIEFNTKGRTDAGFTEEYIRELTIFERSNGRTPNVFYFNPDAENRIARYPEVYHPNSRVTSIIEDLEILPAFLARRDDVLLLRKPPSFEHRERLHAAGFVLPEIEPLGPDGKLDASGLLIERKVDQLCPWARSPDLPTLFSKLRRSESDAGWKDSDRPLFSKESQVTNLQKWMGPSYPVQNADDLIEASQKLIEEGWTEGIIKRPFSTAGSGMQRLSLDNLEKFKGAKMNSGNSHEGGILLEPAHQRVLDFSIQYTLEKGQLRLNGFVEQIIFDFGRYGGSLSFPKFCSGFSPEIARFIMEHAVPVYEIFSPFTNDLLNWAIQHGYEGPLGVDAYLYLDQKGAMKLRAACEINTRFTMGRVAMGLQRQVAPNHGVKLEIIKTTDLGPDLPPPKMAEGKLSSGSLTLNEIGPESRFAARITVAKQQSAL